MDINTLHIDELDLSVRTRNCLLRAGIFTFGEMVEFHKKGVLPNIPNMGAKSVTEVVEKIELYSNSNLAETETKAITTDSTLLSDDNFEKWSKSEVGREFIVTFLNAQNAEIGMLSNLSSKAYNLLTFNGKKYIADVLFLDKTELMNIKMMDIFTATEITMSCSDCINTNKENIITSFNASLNKSAKSTNTVFDIIHSLQHREKILAYVKSNDIFIGEWDIENRPKNQLLKCGFSYLSDIIFTTEAEFYRLPAMGKGSVDNILEKRQEYLDIHSGRILAFCDGDFSAIITDEDIEKKILCMYSDKNFYGFSFKEFTENLKLSVNIDENRLKSIIGKMIANEKLEYIDYRCYRRYPKFKDYLKKSSAIAERSKSLILKRLDGATLKTIGTEFDLTRERIRQIEKKDFNKLRNQCKAETGVACFDEDYYETFFNTYSFNKSDAEKWFGLTNSIFNYMEMRNIKQGNKNLLDALDDDKLDIGLKLKIKNYLNRNKILLDGMWIEKRRSELENYFLSKFCEEDISFSDFSINFNSFLESEKIPYDEKLYYTEGVLKSRKNHLSESRVALWKQNELIRYYDIDARDYSELLNTLNLDSYENIEISTLKFIDDYPELMQKYDIRDQYELHNLLRKIVPENSYNNFRCGRTPILCFGEFDRNKAIIELIVNNAPLTQEELLDLVRKEYGFESGAIIWKNFGEYYYQGVYRIDYKPMSEEAKTLLKENLTEDFYYIEEIKKIYINLLPGADLSEINPYNLKLMGFSVLSRYAYQNYPSLEAYYSYLLTKSDIIDITPYRKRFTYIQAFSGTFINLKRNKTIFEFDPNHIISKARLESGGVTDEVIENFCDNVFEFVKNNTFFSIKTLKNEGFDHEIFELGFSDWFYANILAEDARFSYQQIFNNIILYKGKTNVTIKSFEKWLVKSAGSIDTYDLMTEMINYGCKINEKSDITHRLYGTEIYYDNILDRFYSSAEAYYRELEESEVVY